MNWVVSLEWMDAILDTGIQFFGLEWDISKTYDQMVMTFTHRSRAPQMMNPLDSNLNDLSSILSTTTEQTWHF